MAGELRDYISWLHDQECAAVPCANRDIEAHHGGKHGMGLRNSDQQALPLCSRHHRQITSFRPDKRGFFYRWTLEELRAWERAQADASLSKYYAEQAALETGTATEKQAIAALRRKGFDPKDFAVRWCKVKELGEQLALDLARDLKRELREGGIPI